MRRPLPLSLLLLVVSCLASLAEEPALIRMGDHWRYWRADVDGPAPHSKWLENRFDDTRWPLAMSGLVLPEEEPRLASAAAPKPFKAYLRRQFKISDLKSVYSLVLQVEHETGFTAYLNGTEIAHHHAAGVRYPTAAERAAGMEDPEVHPAILDVSEFIPLLEPGDNVLALEATGSGENLSPITAAASLVVNFPRGPFLANVTTNSATLVWRTGAGSAAAGSSFVDYGLTDALGSLYTNGTPVTEHVATLTDLQPDTTYYYRVGSALRGTLRPVSSISTFRTARMSGPVRFAVFGDSGQATEAQSQIAGVLRNARPDLVLHCGDIVYGGFNDGTVDTRFFSYYAPHLRTTPYYLTAGNHDIGCCAGESPDWNQPSWALRATNFQNAFYLPTNNLTGTEHFYSFDHGDVHFVCLYNPWFPNYNFPAGIDQLTWLTNDLSASTKPWKMLFLHTPAGNSGLHAGTDTDNDGQTDQAEILHLLHPIAREYGVQMIFGGHDHNFERFAPTNGLHHCVNGGGGGGVYQMTARHMASSQFWANNNCTVVTVEGDTMKLEVLNVSGVVFDSMVIRKTPTPDVIHQSVWNTPSIETEAADDGDGNIMGQTFDFKGQAMVTKAGEFSNLGWAYVNNDSTNLYLGIKSAMYYGNNNVFLFIATPRLAGITNLIGLGNGLSDPNGEGVDGLDFLENLSFTNFAPSIACVLGDEFADGPFRSFARTGLFDTGQGVYRLDSGFSDIAGCRIQQFNRSPQNGPVPDDANADFIEISIPLSELGHPVAGEIIQIGAVVGGSSVDATGQKRELDSSVLGTSLSTDAAGQTWLAGVKVRLASLPDMDRDGDGLLDDWEYQFSLNPDSAIGDDGAEGDPDHDGVNNAREQMTGTDPRDATSAFRLTLTAMPASRYVVKWRTIPGQRYQLEYSDDIMAEFAPIGAAGWPRLALSTEEVYLDNTFTNQAAASQRNYRVRLVP